MKTYFENIAYHIPAITHGPSRKRFYSVFNVSSMFSFAGNNDFLNDMRIHPLEPVMLYINDNTGKLTGTSIDNKWELHYGHCYIVKKLKQNDFDEKETWFQQCKTIFDDVIACIDRDLKQGIIPRTFNILNIDFREVHNQADQFAGLGISFSWQTKFCKSTTLPVPVPVTYGTLSAVYVDDADYNDIIRATLPATNNTSYPQACVINFKTGKYIVQVQQTIAANSTAVLECVIENVDIFQENIVTAIDLQNNIIGSITIPAYSDFYFTFSPTVGNNIFTITLGSWIANSTIDFGNGEIAIINEMSAYSMGTTIIFTRTYIPGNTYTIRFSNARMLKYFAITTPTIATRALFNFYNLKGLRNIAAFYLSDFTSTFTFVYNVPFTKSEIKKLLGIKNYEKVTQCEFFRIIGLDNMDDSYFVSLDIFRNIHLRYGKNCNFSSVFFQQASRATEVYFDTLSNSDDYYACDITVPSILNYPAITSALKFAYFNVPDISIDSDFGDGYSYMFQICLLPNEVVDRILRIIDTKNNYTGTNAKTIYINGQGVGRRTIASNIYYNSLLAKRWAISCYNPNTVHGYLYNWYVIETGLIAPVGTHVPTRAEIDILFAYLGGASVAGGKMKQTGTTYWLTPNTGATNESGYSALGTGYRTDSGTFTSMNNILLSWTSTEISAEQAYRYRFDYNSASTSIISILKKYGATIRCLLDDPNDWFAGMTITDYEGNVYDTVKIGTQVWLTSDLRCTKYRNGTPIPHVINGSGGNGPKWNSLTTPAYCSYNNT